LVVIKWHFDDLLKEGVAGANLVFGALLSAYVGVNLPLLPKDVRFEQAVMWFFWIFWFVFSLNLSFFAFWSRSWSALVGYLFVTAFAGQYVVRSAAQFGLDARLMAAIFVAWVLVLSTLAIMLHRALGRAASRAK
jgi:hypothetical protein